MSESRHNSLDAVAGTVSRETFLRLERFEDVFVKWASTINLVAPSTLPNLWQRHILDSAQLAPLAPNALRWLDLGSGGGFPGAVMAILLRDRAGGYIDLVESNQKKASFLRTALGQASAPAVVHSIRIEQSWAMVTNPEIVTARALAPMVDLLRLSEPWLASGSRGLFHKGREYRREIEECVPLWTYDLVEHPSRVDPDSVILDVQNLRRR